jgi:hypothetical protein
MALPALGLCLLGSLGGCSLAGYLQPHEKLLNEVKLSGAPPKQEESLRELVRQQPNRRILGVFRYHMWRYVVTRAAERQLLRQELSKGAVKGEPPVVLDTNLAEMSIRDMKGFMQSKGYFNVRLDYRVQTTLGLDFWRPALYKLLTPGKFGVNPLVERRALYRRTAAQARRRAALTFQLEPGQRYRIGGKSYFIADRLVDSLVRAKEKASLIDTGDYYDSELLGQERTRISRLLRKSGYYNFSQEFIFFDVDTSQPGATVNVGVRVNNPPDTARHIRSYIDSIFVRTQDPFPVRRQGHDTTIEGVTFQAGPQIIKPQALRHFITLRPGQLYDERDIDNTIKRLSDIPVLRFVNVRLEDPQPGKAFQRHYDVVISVTPNKKYVLSGETEATSSEVGNQANTIGRFYGVAASGQFRNQNFLHQAIEYGIQLRGAIEFGSDTLSNLSLDDFSNLRLQNANTKIDVTNSLKIPKLLFLQQFDKGSEINQTNINLTLSQESSLQFDSRRSLDFNYQYAFNDKLNTNFVTPVQITFVSADNSESFEELLEDTTSETVLDPSVRRFFSTNRYVFTFSRWNIVYNGKPVAGSGGWWDIQYNAIEAGGNVLRWFENTFPEAGRQDTLFGVPYFRYLKSDVDARYYLPSGKNAQWVFRAGAGLAWTLPLERGRSNLPFEKRYFIGGSNNMRAWRARSLGPGSYEDEQFTGINQSGDMRLLFNIEYRFPIYSLVKGALFVDAGNIWQNNLQGGETEGIATIEEPINLRELGKEIAIGTGFGLRFDADFFIFRTDLGLRVHDPANRLQGEEPWIIRDFNWGAWTNENVRLNIGIGYPF